MQLVYDHRYEASPYDGTFDRTSSRRRERCRAAADPDEGGWPRPLSYQRRGDAGNPGPFGADERHFRPLAASV